MNSYHYIRISVEINFRSFGTKINLQYDYGNVKQIIDQYGTSSITNKIDLS